MNRYAASVLLMLVTTACGQGNERLAEKAAIEGRAQAEADLNVTNSNLEAKASKMEADLALRHAYYQALEGSFEGELTTEKAQYKIRVSFASSIPPYRGTRTRQLEEISADLNALALHVQVLQWNPANQLSAVGCTVEGIRPDISRGEIVIASTSCANLYRLRIIDPSLEQSEAGAERSKRAELATAVATARAVRDGRIASIPEIRGEVQPTTNASIYRLAVRRLEVR